jgi:hypothetical protein
MKQLREQLLAEKNEILLAQQQGLNTINEITIEYTNRLRGVEEKLEEVNAKLQHFISQ